MGRNKYVGKWTETRANHIDMKFTIESIEMLITSLVTNENMTITHQDFVNWCEDYYKHKLNMLEPGLKMIKMIGLFGVLSLVFYCINAVLLSFLCGCLAVVLGIILWILILIEQHQDNVLNQLSINERKKNGED